MPVARKAERVEEEKNAAGKCKPQAKWVRIHRFEWGGEEVTEPRGASEGKRSCRVTTAAEPKGR